MKLSRISLLFRRSSKKVKIPLDAFLERKVRIVAESSGLSFDDAIIFLLNSVITPDTDETAKHRHRCGFFLLKG